MCSTVPPSVLIKRPLTFPNEKRVDVLTFTMDTNGITQPPLYGGQYRVAGKPFVYLRQIMTKSSKHTTFSPSRNVLRNVAR